jgi:protein TonB
LGVPWESARHSFWTSFQALLRGPAPPLGWPLGPFFQDAWIRGRVPRGTILVSAALHCLGFLIPYPALLPDSPEVREPFAEHYQLTWAGPVRDLAPLKVPAAGKPARPSPPGEPEKPLPRKGADAYHPRQFIISHPPKPNHPRQTLIQPDAPPAPPKILPPLPNIVQWSEMKQPERPRLKIDASQFRKHRAVTRRVEDVAAPEVTNQQRVEGPVNIAAGSSFNRKPALPIVPMSAPRASAPVGHDDPGAAPEVGPVLGGGDLGASRLIALSATPAPLAPNPEIPPGNLAARITITPEGLQSGVPGGSADGTAAGTGGSGGGPGSPGGTGGSGGSQPGTGGGGNGRTGPPGITISGGNPNAPAGHSGSGAGSGMPLGKPASPRNSTLPERPVPRIHAPEVSRTPRSLGDYAPGAPPEIILGPRRIYTLNVNMPNLNSATGSWVLQFAEFDEERARKSSTEAPPAIGNPFTDLVGPVPLRKVDPQYPPALRAARIEGKVVLYAIIRKDGTVDSIQIVRSLDPQLDRNAMDALARWVFRPAERLGSPVELEALVTIPFRAVAPL